MTQTFTVRPMMSEKEIGIINRLIKERKPEICLEWGSGGSTVYFPDRHECIKQWVSVEHDGHYNIFLKDKIHPEKVVLVWADNDYRYIDVVKHQGQRYDFILVDGAMRNECLKAAQHLLKEDGFVLLHDSGRKDYDEGVEAYGNRKEKLCDGEHELDDGSFVHRGLLKLWM